MRVAPLVLLHSPLLLLLLLLAAGPSQAASAVANFCGHQVAPSAEAQDRHLRFTAHVRAALQARAAVAPPEAGVAIIARSGLDLARFGLRYSHAGLALAEGAGTPWAVRQLYYACEEGRPRLFDQGLAGLDLVAHVHQQGHDLAWHGRGDRY